MDKSVFKLVGIPKQKILAAKNNVDAFITPEWGGTCFFISPNTFITASHVLDSKRLKNFQIILMNSNGEVITDSITLIMEDTQCDITVARIQHKRNFYLNLVAEKFNCPEDYKLNAYGFTHSDATAIRMKVRVSGEKIKLIETTKPTLEQVECGFNYEKNYSEIVSRDGSVHLKNCLMYALNPALRGGFSGGPIIDPTSNNVVAFSSFNISFKRNGVPTQGILVKPIDFQKSLAGIAHD